MARLLMVVTLPTGRAAAADTIATRLQLSVVVVTPVDEQMLVLRLKYLFGFMSLITVYDLTDTCQLNVKEMFSGNLTSVADSCPWRDIHDGLGDSETLIDFN